MALHRLRLAQTNIFSHFTLRKSTLNVFICHSALSQSSRMLSIHSNEQKQLSIQHRIRSFWEGISRISSAYYQGSKLLVEHTRQVKNLKQQQHRKPFQYSRKEFMLIKTNADDIKRIMPFFIVLILIPETLPFFLMRGADIIPSTCILPDQLLAKREKLKKVRHQLTADAITSILNGQVLEPESLTKPETIKHLAAFQPQHFEIHGMMHDQLVQYSKLMGFSTWRPSWMLKSKLKKHFQFLKEDDMLLKSEGLEGLSMEELQLACEDRGIVSVGLERANLADKLYKWIDLHTTPDPHIQPGLMMLYSTVNPHFDKTSSQLSANETQ
ncbi:hypothetical protein QVD99_003419 [Batrachochytrium dendrobatidis]|nr:hypothetical protein O5D80_005073 [Batrachochytrium dendrobatidis]KAK5670098.1 hypothetical protein QVD99_003419 [Batrachochytrium dendrobatidis]